MILLICIGNRILKKRDFREIEFFVIISLDKIQCDKSKLQVKNRHLKN